MSFFFCCHLGVLANFGTPCWGYQIPGDPPDLSSKHCQTTFWAAAAGAKDKLSWVSEANVTKRLKTHGCEMLRSSLVMFCSSSWKLEVCWTTPNSCQLGWLRTSHRSQTAADLAAICCHATQLWNSVVMGCARAAAWAAERAVSASHGCPLPLSPASTFGTDQLPPGHIWNMQGRWSRMYHLLASRPLLIENKYVLHPAGLMGYPQQKISKLQESTQESIRQMVKRLSCRTHLYSTWAQPAFPKAFHLGVGVWSPNICQTFGENGQ